MTTRNLDLSTHCINDRERLVEAYHMCFDVKDHMEPSDPREDVVRYAMYEACQKISFALEQLGYTPPRRNDHEGR